MEQVRQVKKPLMALAIVLLVAIICFGMATSRSTAATTGLSQPNSLQLVSFPTHIRAGWNAVPGATDYRVSLIRQRDQGITRQFLTTDTITEVQPVFPGEIYKVAVEALDSAGHPGPAALSSNIKVDDSAITGLNGFYDGEDVGEGSVDTNRWDVQVMDEKGGGGAFVNDQIHFHIMANSPTDDQAITTMRARVPVNMQSSRTAHIHGEVDLKSDMTQWFGFALSPSPLGANEPADLDDRDAPTNMPVLEVFDSFDGKLHLLQGYGDGSGTHDLGSVANPIKVNNVRSAVDLYVNQSHATVYIDGRKAFDVNLPHGLGMPNQAWLTLFAEDYPGSGGGGHYEACDKPGQPCNIWHLDSWGFDAPKGTSEPATRVFYADGCGPAAPIDLAKNVYPGINSCSPVDLRYASSATVPTSVNVNVSSTQHLQSAALLVRADDVQAKGWLRVRINGGSWLDPEYFTTRWDTPETYRFVIPTNLLRAGGNTIEFLGHGYDSPEVSDIHLDALTDQPFKAPDLPAQPAVIAFWGGKQPLDSPGIASFTPARAAPGKTVTIDGLGFTGASKVIFGNATVTTGIMVHSDNELMVTVPTGATTGPVTIVTPSKTISSTQRFVVLSDTQNVKAANSAADQLRNFITVVLIGVGCLAVLGGGLIAGRAARAVATLVEGGMGYKQATGMVTREMIAHRKIRLPKRR